MYLTVRFMAWVQFPAMVEYFKGFFLVDHNLRTRPEPALQKMAQSPVNSTTQSVGIEAEGRNPTTDRRWLNDKKGAHKTNVASNTTGNLPMCQRPKGNSACTRFPEVSGW